MREIDPSRLPKPEGLQLARLAGVGRRWMSRPLDDAGRAQAVAELHQVTTDAHLLGLALGHAQAELELTSHGKAELVGLYEAAGGDPEVAAAAVQRQRDRVRQTGRP